MGERAAAAGARFWPPGDARSRRAERHFMGFQYFAGAACRALTARKDGPSLYEVCDPLLLKHHGGDQHLAKFYRTALGNPALRPLLRRTGLAELNDASRLERLREALIHARDDTRCVRFGEMGVAFHHRQRFVAEHLSDFRKRCAVHSEITGGAMTQVSRKRLDMPAGYSSHTVT